ncbi:MAG: chaperone NapD [Bacteroidales bacterium]|nr:chaperone NapD [Bacteroidales bacterium]
MNISSIVIQTSTTKLNRAIEFLTQSNLCDYHHSDELGRIIITIEGETAEEEMAKLRQIQQLDFVISAEMHFSYSENELDKLRSDLELNPNNIPQWLNDDTPAEEIRYNGDLRKEKRKN